MVLLLIFIFSVAYAATTRNEDYVKMEGLKQLVSDQEHRQEIVVNGLGPYLSHRAFSIPITHNGFVHRHDQNFLNSVVALEAARVNFGATFSFTSARRTIRFIS